MAPNPLTEVRRATAQREKVTNAWRAAIIGAHAQGETVRAIAEAAGISFQRVHQIVQGK